MKWLENKSMVNFVEYVTLDVEWHLTAPISQLRTVAEVKNTDILCDVVISCRRFQLEPVYYTKVLDIVYVRPHRVRQ